MYRLRHVESQAVDKGLEEPILLDNKRIIYVRYLL